jgi:Uncharacterised nucleotidyltransferase
MLDRDQHGVAWRGGEATRDVHGSLWRAVDDVVDRAPTADDLRAHRLHLLAAQRLRVLGQTVPNEFVAAERLAAAVTLAAEIALERAREAYDGTLVLMKGLEVAQRYPNPTLRPFRDIDLLVDRPHQAQRALIAAGFEPVGREDRFYEDQHHLRPLLLPGLPVLLELHRRPVWISWAPPPSTAELLSEAVDSATAIAGLLAPSPAHHALLLAAHAWMGTPLRRILDLVDTTVVAEEADPVELWDAARRWQLDGVWRTTMANADAVLFGAPPLPWHVRLWAGRVSAVRDRTLFRDHVVRLLSPFSVLPPNRALKVAAQALGRTLHPAANETWGVKAARVRRALRHASERVSIHDEIPEEGRP